MKNWQRLGAALLCAVLLAAPVTAAAAEVPVTAFNQNAYKDVLSTLSAGEKDKLFQKRLCWLTEAWIGQSGYDVRSSSEDSILACIQWLDIVSRFSYTDYGAMEGKGDYLHRYTFRKADFDRLTSDLLGRTLSFEGHTVTSIPSVDDVKHSYNTYLYNGTVYLFMPQAGSVTNERAEPHHLYQLKNNLYCATYTIYEWYMDESNKQEKVGTYQAIVQRKNNNWTLLYLSKKGGTIDDATLSAFQSAYNQPSDWAAAEVSAAQAAGLGVGLSGDPGWQDQATRLQFAQVAVQMAEKASGKTLETAPAGTFGDCSDAAVLKAYQAGIVNGTADTTFSPNGTLDRETLATMLWRALEYVRKNGGTIAMVPTGNLNGFTDAKNVSSWAAQAVAALNSNGIMKGTSTTSLAPKEPCTVEQSVILAYRTLQKFS